MYVTLNVGERSLSTTMSPPATFARFVESGLNCEMPTRNSQSPCSALAVIGVNRVAATAKGMRIRDDMSAPCGFYAMHYKFVAPVRLSATPTGSPLRGRRD